MKDIKDWVIGHLPDGLFGQTPQISVDREEITIVGSMPDDLGTGGIDAYREATRAERMAVAARAEEIFGRKVAWGVIDADRTVLFTNMAVPVMTRLRQPERQVLDTLVSAGVARSRADALAWCVRLVGRHESDWIARMRDALGAVHEARESGPDSRSDTSSSGPSGT